MTDNSAVSSSSGSTYPDHGGHYQGTYRYYERVSPLNAGDSESNGMIGSSPSSGITSPAKSFDSFSPTNSFVSPPPSQISTGFPQPGQVFNFDNDFSPGANDPRAFNGTLNVDGTLAGSHGNGFHPRYQQQSYSCPSYAAPPPAQSTYLENRHSVPAFNPSDASRSLDDGSKLPYQVSSKNTHSSFMHSTHPQYSPNQESYYMQPNCSTNNLFDHNSTSHLHHTRYPYNQHWNHSVGFGHDPAFYHSLNNRNNLQFRPKSVHSIPHNNRQRLSDTLAQSRAPNLGRWPSNQSNDHSLRFGNAPYRFPHSCSQFPSRQQPIFSQASDSR